MNPGQHNAALDAARAEMAEAQQRSAALAEESRMHQQAAAERAVHEAICRGVIPPQARKLREAWIEACVSDCKIIELLAMMPGSPALQSHRGPSLFQGRAAPAIQEHARTPAPEDSAMPVYEFPV